MLKKKSIGFNPNGTAGNGNIIIGTILIIEKHCDVYIRTHVLFAVKTINVSVKMYFCENMFPMNIIRETCKLYNSNNQACTIKKENVLIFILYYN